MGRLGTRRFPLSPRGRHEAWWQCAAGPVGGRGSEARHPCRTSRSVKSRARRTILPRPAASRELRGGSMATVAQLVRAPGCGPGGRGFESRRSPFSPFQAAVPAPHWSGLSRPHSTPRWSGLSRPHSSPWWSGLSRLHSFPRWGGLSRLSSSPRWGGLPSSPRWGGLSRLPSSRRPKPSPTGMSCSEPRPPTHLMMSSCGQP
jgi:hypothetical protein